MPVSTDDDDDYTCIADMTPVKDRPIREDYEAMYKGKLWIKTLPSACLTRGFVGTEESAVLSCN